VNKQEPIEAELVTVNKTQLRSVSVSPNQLRKQMQRDQEMRAVIDEYIKNNMTPGKDYGSIEVKKGSGIMSKPGLFKPGAEKFCGLFKIRPTFRKDPETVEMLGSTAGIIAYICELVDSRGQIMGEGRGTAKTDPVHGADFDINKQVKIAQKRAQVDAVLRTGGLSDFFTQDLEDMPRDGGTSEPTVRPATIKQKNLISKLFLERGAKTPNLLLASIKANGVANPKEMSAAEASDIIEKLFANSAEVVTELPMSDEEREHLENISGRGAGDPDMHGNPYETSDDLSDEQIAANLDEAERNLMEEGENDNGYFAQDRGNQ
jgi:hypothetical protein